MSEEDTAPLGTRKEVASSIGTLEYSERGTGHPLVFLHGIIANGDVWHRVVPQLAAQYRCITLELPLGAHSRPASATVPLTPDTLASAVVEVFDALGLQQPVLVGNDTGGVFAQIAATTSGERLGGLVLTSCDAFTNFLPMSLRYTQAVARVPGGTWLMAQALRVPFVRSLPIAFGWLVKHPQPDEVWRSFRQPAVEHRFVRRDLGRFLRSISTRYTRRTARLLPDFAGPTLFAWADTTRVFPIEHAHRLAAAMPDATVQPVPDSYAFVPLDQPRVLAAAITDFLAARVGQ